MSPHLWKVLTVTLLVLVNLFECRAWLHWPQWYEADSWRLVDTSIRQSVRPEYGIWYATTSEPGFYTSSLSRGNQESDIVMTIIILIHSVRGRKPVTQQVSHNLSTIHPSNLVADCQD